MIRRAIRGLMTASLIGFLFLPLLDHLAWLDRGIVGVAMLMVYLVARYWGALLPYLAELGIKADGDSGMRTALLYLANILGAAAGSILTGFVAMDRLGLPAIAAVLVVAGLLCVILLIAALEDSAMGEARTRQHRAGAFAFSNAVRPALVEQRAREPAMEGLSAREAVHTRDREPQRHHHRRHR